MIIDYATPQKKKRRFSFLWLFVLVVCGAWEFGVYLYMASQLAIGPIEDPTSIIVAAVVAPLVFIGAVVWRLFR